MKIFRLLLLLLVASLGCIAQDLVRIQVLFHMQEGSKYQFTDALYFTQAEYALLTQKQINDLKQARFDAYKNAVDHPPVVIPPTKPELQAQLVELQKQVQIVTGSIAALP